MRQFYAQFFARSVRGVTAVEYAIPTAIVVGAVVLALNASNIQGAMLPWFQGTVNANGTTVQSYGMTDVTASAALTVPIGTNPTTGAPVLPPPDVGEEQVCFNSGLCVNIPVIPTDSVIETSATTGAWATQVANVLQQIAQQIEMTKGQSPLTAALIALANKGHDIGYTMEGLPPVGLVENQGHGYVGLDPSGLEMVNGMYAIGGLDQEFMEQLNAVNAILESDSGWKDSHPELADIVNFEAKVIHQLAQGVGLTPSEHGVGDIQLNGGDLGSVPSAGNASGLTSGDGSNKLGSGNSASLGAGDGTNKLGSGNSASLGAGDGTNKSGSGNSTSLGGDGQQDEALPLYMSPEVNASGVHNSSNAICGQAGSMVCLT